VTRLVGIIFKRSRGSCFEMQYLRNYVEMLVYYTADKNDITRERNSVKC